jgi:hypothetical protein
MFGIPYEKEIDRAISAFVERNGAFIQRGIRLPWFKYWRLHRFAEKCCRSKFKYGDLRLWQLCVLKGGFKITVVE